VFLEKDLCKRAVMAAFVLPGLERLTMIIDEKYPRSIAVAEHIGFRKEGLLRGHYDDCDGVLLGLVNEEE
jgi:RimJ/RimL family protein N-acetyltransferase